MTPRSLAALAVLAAAAARGPERARIPAGAYRPFFLEASTRSDAGAARELRVPAFELDVRPVTRGEFLEFVHTNPAWRRSRVPRIFAEGGYLAAWESDLVVPRGTEGAPVTQVSWFAAKAYCRSRGASLPTVAQWERAADDPAATVQVLAWYAQPSSAALRDAGSGPENRYGVRDLHGLVWEWVLDFNESMVTDDGRDEKGGDTALFCGSGAAKAADPSDAARFMRYGFRSSLKATYALRELGFRCARQP